MLLIWLILILVLVSQNRFDDLVTVGNMPHVSNLVPVLRLLNFIWIEF